MAVMGMTDRDDSRSSAGHFISPKHEYERQGHAYKTDTESKVKERRTLNRWISVMARGNFLTDLLTARRRSRSLCV